MEEFGSDMANQSLNNNTSRIGEGKLHRLLNFGEGWVTVKYTTVFLHSAWLYFLWHGIN